MTDRPLDPNTRLAAERTRLALERTLMAWTRTATSLIAFGFTIFQIFEQLAESERLAALQPADVLLPDHTAVTLGSEDAGRFLSGMRRRGAWADAEQVVVYGEAPAALLGVAHVAGGELIPDRLLSPTEIAETLAQTAIGRSAAVIAS